MFYVGKEKQIEILIDDLNELVRKGCAMWLKLGEYEFALDKLSKCPTTTWYSIHQMLYSLEPWRVIKESKESARKSIKESKEINLIDNVANKLRKITDAYVDTYRGADWISLGKDEYAIKIIYTRNELSIGLYKDGDFKDGEFEYASGLSDDDFSVNYIIDFIKNFIKNRNYLKNKISIKESKKSAKISEGRKVDEFIIYYVDGNGEPEGYEVYGIKQLKSALKWLHSDEVNAISIDVYKRGKNFDNDNDDVIEYYSWVDPIRY